MKLLYSYHDAELTGAAYSRTDASALLNFERVAGSQSRLLFSGIKAIRINDYGLQNVASRLLISPSHAFSNQEIRGYVSWAQSQHDFKASVTDEEARSLTSAIATGELNLFVLEPSVGVEAVILCSEIKEIV